MAEMYPPISLGETAENVAERYHVTRERQDEFALRSHQRAAAARDAGRFAGEIVPVTTPAGEVTADEGIRADLTLAELAGKRPAFRRDGTVTGGNSSPLNDGAAVLLLVSERALTHDAPAPLARYAGTAAAGVHPDYMGIGPVPSTLKALDKARLEVKDIDVVELNEAFASQAVACMRLLGLDEERVNVNGGAIALGHPLGSSGARLVSTLVREMRHRDSRYGLATMCIGVGQGIASIWEYDG
jgi:acetyl-CoA C-acetyltransferase/3-oxo-5,6-didehydrosuberyl-CoA/3-oxoadipyl-CoA thiolase